MTDMSVFKVICTFLIGILGPFLCYIVVYGSIFLINRAYLQIKAIRFRKRIAKAKSKKDEDDFEDIEVDIVTSYDKKDEQEE